MKRTWKQDEISFFDKMAQGLTEKGKNLEIFILWSEDPAQPLRGNVWTDKMVKESFSPNYDAMRDPLTRVKEIVAKYNVVRLDAICRIVEIDGPVLNGKKIECASFDVPFVQYIHANRYRPTVQCIWSVIWSDTTETVDKPLFSAKGEWDDNSVYHTIMFSGPRGFSDALAFFSMKTRDPATRSADVVFQQVLEGDGSFPQPNPQDVVAFRHGWLSIRTGDDETPVRGENVLENRKRSHDKADLGENDEEPSAKRSETQGIWNPDKEAHEIHQYGQQVAIIYGCTKIRSNDLVKRINARSKGRFYLDWNRSMGHTCFFGVGDMQFCSDCWYAELPKHGLVRDFLNPPEEVWQRENATGVIEFVDAPPALPVESAV